MDTASLYLNIRHFDIISLSLVLLFFIYRQNEPPDATLIAVKIGLDNAVEFEQQINSYLKAIQQILDATESFKKTQDRKSYNALIKSSSSAVNELDKSRELFLKYNDGLSRLNALLVSLDKVSSKIVPSLSRNTGIIFMH